MVKATGLQLKELKSEPNILPTKFSQYIASYTVYVFCIPSGLYCSLLTQMRVKTQQIMSSCKSCKPKTGHCLLSNTKELELYKIIIGYTWSNTLPSTTNQNAFKANNQNVLQTLLSQF